MFLLWRLEWYNVEPTYDRSIDPYRQGAIIFATHTEPGAGDGRADLLHEQLLELLASGDPSGRLVIMPEASTPIAGSLRGPWWVDGVTVPVSAG